MATFNASRSYNILNQGGNNRVGILGEYADMYCPPAATVADVKTITFAAGNDVFEIPRMQCDGSFDTAAITTGNVATISVYLNGVLVSGVTPFVAGDKILVRITRTTLASASSAVITLEHTTSTSAGAGVEYLWEVWENLQNATALADEWNDTTGGLYFDSAGIGYDKGATGSYRATGACRIEFAPWSIRLSCGLSDESPITYPATLWNRVKHCWVVIYPNATCRTLGSVESGAGSLTGVTLQTEFAIEDTGSAIIYQYRHDPAGAWVTHYTSSIAYVPNTVWHSDVCGYMRYQQFKGVKISGGNVV